MIVKKLIEILKTREFLYVATCDLTCRPNVAPKFLLKSNSDHIYLVDYVIGKTYQNLKINPKVSLSFMEIDSLAGYLINGSVEIIDQGQDYEEIVKETHAKEVSFTANRIVEGIHKGRTSKEFEVAFPSKVVIFKVKIEEVVEIGPSGKLTREKV